jgi:CubicO group peptidase (beta-lactamase class C family)
MKTILTGIILLIGHTLCFAQQETDLVLLKHSLKDYIRKTMKSNNIKGLSVALVDDQQIIWSEGFGYEDISKRKRATDTSIYRVASISKLITAISILQQNEWGKINLDTPITNYLPDFSINGKQENVKKITPGRLLTHHSGLPSDILYRFFSYQPEPFNNILNHLKDEYLTNQPGSILSYSNAGYSVLGTLLEKISSCHFIDYTSKLMQQMGMKHSIFIADSLAKNGLAKAYLNDKEIDEPLMRDLPAGGLITTAKDLAQLIKIMFADGRNDSISILSPTTLRNMYAVQNGQSELDFGTQIGYAWFLNENGSIFKQVGGSIGHGGDTWLFHSQISLLPKHKLGVVVLSNSLGGRGTVGRMADKILTEALWVLRGIAVNPKPIRSNIRYIKRENKELKPFEGHYALAGTPFLLKSRKGKLTIKKGFYHGDLIPNNHNSFTPAIRFLGFFTFRVPNIEVKFLNRGGMSLGAIIDKRDTLLLFKKIHKHQIPEAWMKRLGKYIDINPSDFTFCADFELFVGDGFLKFGMRMLNEERVELVLRPISDDLAILEGIGRGTGDVISIKHLPNDEILQFSGLKLHKVTTK